MRYLLTFFLCGYLVCAAVSASTSSNDKSHTVTWGAASPRDVHLSREIITEKAKILRVVSKNYEYRMKPDKYHRTITQIVVTDQYTNGNGGEATLKSGGPNTDFAVIHLKSQRGHGFSFIIDIFGQ